MENILLKVPDVMERLSVGQSKVYELMSIGELRSVKVGRSRRVPSDELERFLAGLDDTRPNLRLPTPTQPRGGGSRCATYPCSRPLAPSNMRVRRRRRVGVSRGEGGGQVGPGERP